MAYLPVSSCLTSFTAWTESPFCLEVGESVVVRHAYTIRYHDKQGREREFCTYAKDAYDARLQAIELVGDIYECPNRIDHILKEPGHFDW